MSARRTKESMKSTGPVHELIAKTPDWRGATLARLREIVRDADPAMVEDVKWRRPGNPNGCAVWERAGIVCAGIILKERVRLSFFAGSSLPDPAKLFNAQLKGKARADRSDGAANDDAARAVGPVPPVRLTNGLHNPSLAFDLCAGYALGGQSKGLWRPLLGVA